MNELPDPTRRDAGLTMSSTWRVGARQQAALDAIAAAWLSRPWPTSDLLGYTVFPSLDGDTLVHFSQWTGDDAYTAFVRDHRDGRNAEIDAAVPGIDRFGLGRFRHHRSLPEHDGRPTAFTIERFADAAQADAVLDGPRPPGLLVAHAFLGIDGALVVRDWRGAAPPPAYRFPLHLDPAAVDRATAGRAT